MDQIDDTGTKSVHAFAGIGTRPLPSARNKVTAGKLEEGNKFTGLKKVVPKEPRENSLGKKENSQGNKILCYTGI